MDPVTALGVACNILALVQQAIEAANACKELYERGSLDENNKIEEYAQGISIANKDLEAALGKQPGTISPRATRLQKIATEASATAAELRKVLNQLKVSKHQIGAAFKASLKTFIKKGTIDRLRDGLERQDAALRSGLLKELYVRAGEDDLTRRSEFTALSQGQKAIIAQVLLVSSDLKTAISQQLKDLSKHQKGQELRRIHKEALEKISSFVYHARYTQILGLRMKGTCRWILDEPKFCKWKDSISSPFLWLSGKMGSGKSTLVATVIESMISSPQKSYRLAYHFCDGTARSSQTVDLILGSLLRQLCQSFTMDILDPLIKRIENEQEGSLRAEECEVFLQPLINSHHTVIIIDALDELSKGVWSNLIKTLERLTKANTKTSTKVFVSSRPMQGIGRLLSQYIKLEVQNQHDLYQYIDAQLEEFLESSHIDLEKSKPQIRKALRNQAGGMFRWLQMSFKILGTNEALTERDVLQAIEKLPTDLEALYDKIYQQIENFDLKDTTVLVRRTLALLMYSEVPLTTQEVLEAVLPNYGTGLHIRWPEDYLLDHCKGLVEWDQTQDVFRLAHATVRSFLETRTGFGFLESHALLANMCLSYLQDSLTDGEPVKTLGLRTFLNYAFVYWPFHALYAFILRFTDSDLSRFFPKHPRTRLERWASHVAKIIDAHMLRRHEEQVAEDTDPESDSQSHEEDAYVNEETKLLNSYISFLSPRRREWLPKHDFPLLYTWKEFRTQIPNPIWALFYWASTPDFVGPETEIDPKLMEIERDVWYTEVARDGSTHEVRAFNSTGPPIGVFAATADYESIKTLTPYVKPSTIELCYYNPPLTKLQKNKKLSEEQVEELFEALLRNGCSPDQVDGIDNGKTALHQAVHDRRLKLIELLLRHNARTEVYSFDDLTPLHQACKSGGKDTVFIIKTLLSRGASVLASGRDGMTCLHFLAENDLVREGEIKSIHEVVKVLISAGHHVDVLDDHKRTPLHLAAIQHRGTNLVRALIEQGATIDMSDTFGWTPIHYATLLEDVSALQTLLKQGKLPDVAEASASTSPKTKSMPNLDSTDILGATATAVAVVLDRRPHLAMLVDHGASLYTKLNEGISLSQLAVARGNANDSLYHFLSLHDAYDLEFNDTLRFIYAQVMNEPSEPGTGLLELTSEKSKATLSQITPAQLTEACDKFRVTPSGKKALQMVRDLVCMSNIRYLYTDIPGPLCDREERKYLQALLNRHEIDVEVPSPTNDGDDDGFGSPKWLRFVEQIESLVENISDKQEDNRSDDDNNDENDDDDEEGEKKSKTTFKEKLLIEKLIGCQEEQ